MASHEPFGGLGRIDTASPDDERVHYVGWWIYQLSRSDSRVSCLARRVYSALGIALAHE